MKINIPTPLRSYTRHASVVDAEGASVGQVLADLERRNPGFRFRIIDEQDGIREHIKIFVNEDQVPNLDMPLRPGDTMHIICALSGGLEPHLSLTTTEAQPKFLQVTESRTILSWRRE